MSMESLKGQPVRSLAGHDKGTLYCVVDAEDGFLFLSDGKHHRLAQPKRKRRSHVEPIAASHQPAPQKLQNCQSDGNLRRALAALRDTLGDTMHGQGGNHAWQKTI
ncbi:MAG: KOW domain-containing RNA-binding protein [Pseudoflavonifractor sp.]